MSEWNVQVFKIDNITKHSGADKLSITNVFGGYPVIFQTDSFKLGDLAVYIPIDSICPNTPEFEFLGSNHRIKAKRLRGIFSMGMLFPASSGMKVGDIVDEQLGITKYEPEIEAIGKGKYKTGSVLTGDNIKDPGFMPVYTDIESIRKWGRVLQEGEEVILSEKIHGCNSRFLYKNSRLWIGSHKCIKRAPWDKENLSILQRIYRATADVLYHFRAKLMGMKNRRLYHFILDNRTKPATDNVWAQAATRYNLMETMKHYPNIVAFGEVYGQVQDLKYGAKQNEVFLRLFDAYDVDKKCYLDYDDFVAFADNIKVPIVPLLYRGEWKNELKELAEGNSTIPGASNIREGFVVRPVKERYDPLLRRIILKCVGQSYLLRKNA